MTNGQYYVRLGLSQMLDYNVNARDPLIPQQPLRPEILLTYELCAAEEDPNSRVEDRLGV